MSKWFTVFLFLLPLCCFGQNGILVIKNASIIDVINNKVVRDKVVVIEGNRIISVDSRASIPKQAMIIDAKGKYLIPGLWDMHTHSLRKGRIEYFFPLFIANGVTGIRDMASDMSLDEIMTIRNDIEKQTIIGPRLYCVTGRVLDGPPQPDTALFTYPADTGAAKRIVQSYKKQGAGFIKVYNMLAKDIYLAIASESKKNDIPFAGHVPFSVTATEASNVGQRSIEHLSGLHISSSSNEAELRADLAKSQSTNFVQSNKKSTEVNFNAAQNYNKEKALVLFSTFVRNETWQCPTLRNLQIVTTHADLDRLMNDDRIKYFPDSLKENWKRVVLLRKTGDSLQRAIYFKQCLRLVAEMQQAGVKILAGTDLSNNFLMPGFSLHDELALMVEAGLSPFESLQTATINPAKFLNREKELGSIESGKIADLILLDDNPLKNIGNTKKIYAVIVNGKLLNRTDLDTLLTRVEEDVKK
jgi:imidazolonepropionase-like amidohydrolase